ncbi:MAG: four helix bundle protein [Niabella sp.]
MDEVETYNIVEDAGQMLYNIRHRSFYLAKDIISFITSAKYNRIYFSLFDQLLRSATSVGANLTEGVAGSSKNDFLKYNTIALKSANETKYWLCLIRDTVIGVDKIIINNLLAETVEVAKIIATIIINSKKQ